MNGMGLWRITKKRLCKIERYMHHILRKTEVDGDVRNATGQPE